MTSAALPVTLRAPRRIALAWGLSVFIWLLPVHILVMAVLFGGLGWPGPVVRVIAAWKEMLIALLVALTLLRVSFGRGLRTEVQWLDVAVAGLAGLALAYLIGANVWFGLGLPIGAQLYGIRDVAFVSLLYFVGRATPQVVETPRFLRVLFLVGLLTSVIAIVERLFVTPQALVVLGAARYVQEFLGAAPLTQGNVYGLPDNYWTVIGDALVRRAGSTYLSAQGFAIPFLIIMPAASLWLLSAERPRAAGWWLAYAMLWVGLLLTLTRMTIAVCLLQTLLIAVVRRRWRLLVGVGAVAAGGFAAALLLVPGFAEFVWATLTWQTGSSVSHLEDWTEGLENLLRYPLGVGLGATEQTAIRFGLTPLASDNQYFKYAVELGLVGLGLHLTVLGGAVTAGVRACFGPLRQDIRDYGLLVAATAVGIALNALTAVVLNSMILAYVFFWLTGAVTTARARV